MNPGTLGRGLSCVLLIGLSSCALDIYILGGDGNGTDAGLDDGGMQIDASTVDAQPADAMPDACVPFPETCNDADDDCDGEVDEDFDTTQDPGNCGGCDIRCFQPNTAGTCVDSLCEYECLPGYVDPDGDVTNGCSYFCTETNGGTEICDLADNDCDTELDEGLDLDTDVDNCGGCGNTCLALNADATCGPPNSAPGTCGFGACDPGFEDVIPQIAGCEYACPIVPPVPETCNGVDEDCDGEVDDLPIPGLGAACADPGFESNMNVGRCDAGVLECSFGVPSCVGFVRPLGNDAACNGVDDDCDMATDEDVDFQNDPRHCGSCAPCDITNAIEGCSGGTCTIVDCLSGFVDDLLLPGEDCLYACTPTGPETCDGVDNDCDHVTDEGVTPPTGFCLQDGECAGTQPTCGVDLCTGGTTWLCEYSGAAELDQCGELVLQEESCDDLDGDCDGQIDESYADKYADCDDGGTGVCRRTGELVCNGNGDGLTCDLTSPVVTPAAETCDNRDEDCDGTVDEGAPDTMVEVTGGTAPFYIYKWEASRPDASAVNVGSTAGRSCSKPGVLPWRNVTKNEAAQACALAGKRLCTESEWQLACAGAAGLAFPYGDTYEPLACNGRDVDLDCTAPDSDQVAVTGRSFSCPQGGSSSCVSPSGAIDMSGNLREWTSTSVGSSFRVRGGGYDNIEPGLRCDFSFIAFTPNTAFANLGFRCCSDTP